MKILVINAGSSSLKYQLIDMTDESVIAKGLADRIGIAGSNIEQKYGEGLKQVFKKEVVLKDHTEAMGEVLAATAKCEPVADMRHWDINGKSLSIALTVIA